MFCVQRISFLFIAYAGFSLFACQPDKIAEAGDKSTISKSIASDSVSSPHKAFLSIASSISKQTKVPVLLPSFIPESNNLPVFAAIDEIDDSTYIVRLDLAENCFGAGACTLGRIKGKSANNSNLPLAGTKVILANGVTGYFVDATCGANCSDSTLSWIEQGNLYQVAIKAEKLETLTKMANSMMIVEN